MRDMKSDPFHHPRLSPQQNKACEMVLNGFTREEIADELVITDGHLCVLLHHARRHGVPIPRLRSVRRHCPTEALKEIVADIGVARAAKQLNITPNAVRIRLRDAA